MPGHPLSTSPLSTHTPSTDPLSPIGRLKSSLVPSHTRSPSRLDLCPFLSPTRHPNTTRAAGNLAPPPSPSLFDRWPKGSQPTPKSFSPLISASLPTPPFLALEYDAYLVCDPNAFSVWRLQLPKSVDDPPSPDPHLRIPQVILRRSLPLHAYLPLVRQQDLLRPRPQPQLLGPSLVLSTASSARPAPVVESCRLRPQTNEISARAARRARHRRLVRVQGRGRESEEVGRHGRGLCCSWGDDRGGRSIGRVLEGRNRGEEVGEGRDEGDEGWTDG